MFYIGELYQLIYNVSIKIRDIYTKHLENYNNIFVTLMQTIFFVNFNMSSYLIMVHYTYSTINDTILESSGPIRYSYKTIEVISAIVTSINNPSKVKDITSVMKTLILKGSLSNTNDVLIVDSGKMNSYTGGDIDFGSRKKMELQLKYSNLVHTHDHLHPHGHLHGHLHGHVYPHGHLHSHGHSHGHIHLHPHDHLIHSHQHQPCTTTTVAATPSTTVVATPSNQLSFLDGFTKRSSSLYYAITSPNGVDSSSTLGENPNQSFRCLTNSTWSKYNGSGYVNFVGSKFTPDTERSSDYTCIKNTIFKEQIILTLPVDKNKSQISTSGDSHKQINALAFYRDEPVAQGIDQTLSSDGKAFYLTSDGKMIVEVIFKTADQEFVDKVKAEDKDSKLVVGNKVRTINLYEKV